jgi:hypothetical protein
VPSETPKGLFTVPAVDPHDRVLIAKIAAETRWAFEPDRTAATAPARAGLQAKYERQVDPDGTLPPDERARLAGHLSRVHMTRMSRAAAAARTARASARSRRGRQQVTDASPDTKAELDNGASS